MTKKKPIKRPANNRVISMAESMLRAPSKPISGTAENGYWTLRAKEIAVRAIYAGILQRFQRTRTWEDNADWIKSSRIVLQDVEIAHAVSDAAMITKAGREADCQKELGDYQAAILKLADCLKEHLDAETKPARQSS